MCVCVCVDGWDQTSERYQRKERDWLERVKGTDGLILPDKQPS